MIGSNVVHWQTGTRLGFRSCRGFPRVVNKNTECKHFEGLSFAYGFVFCTGCISS